MKEKLGSFPHVGLSGRVEITKVLSANFTNGTGCLVPEETLVTHKNKSRGRGEIVYEEVKSSKICFRDNDLLRSSFSY